MAKHVARTLKELRRVRSAPIFKCVGGVVLSDSLQCTDEAEFVICLHLKKSERDHYIVFIPEYDPRDRKKYGKHQKKIATRLNCLVW